MRCGVQSLKWEDHLEKGEQLTPVFLIENLAQTEESVGATVHGVAKESP